MVKNKLQSPKNSTDILRVLWSTPKGVEFSGVLFRRFGIHLKLAAVIHSKRLAALNQTKA
ncbi:MAG: hypothetical protein LBG58_03635 [Planctomycetaceae bacterium]|nr:hypothetical protein [Planctomycetaceae bacterium]